MKEIDHDRKQEEKREHDEHGGKLSALDLARPAVGNQGESAKERHDHRNHCEFGGRLVFRRKPPKRDMFAHLKQVIEKHECKQCCDHQAGRTPVSTRVHREQQNCSSQLRAFKPFTYAAVPINA